MTQHYNVDLPTLEKLTNISARVDYLTRAFMGKPYLTNPQGEGIDAQFDQSPLYRFDGFDCVTFVNTILALALSHDLPSFEKKMVQINYYNDSVTFDNRFHFMSVDWNPQNQKNQIVKDITTTVVDENKNPIAEFAQGEIDRPNWFLKRAENESVERAKYLKDIAKKMKKEFVSLPYLPLSKLFYENKPQQFLFNQIPSASIIEIVRPNWNLKDKIGTVLHVSHIGFAIRNESGELFFRHASSENKQVEEVRLSHYLSHTLNNPTIKGINVQTILF